LNEDFVKISYKSLYCGFSTTEWAQVYLKINFGNVGTVYWDGISLEGLDDTFESYYTKLFPLSLEAYKGCIDSSLVIPDKDSYSGSVVVASPKTQDKEVIRWDLGNQIVEGVYRLYYVVRSLDPLPDDMEWAIVLSTNQFTDVSSYEEIARLHITRDYMKPRSEHLETVRLRLKPDTTLVIWEKEGLDKKILLDKLWISPLQ